MAIGNRSTEDYPAKSLELPLLNNLKNECLFRASNRNNARQIDTPLRNAIVGSENFFS
jgi:hypothetical protein